MAKKQMSITNALNTGNMHTTLIEGGKVVLGLFGGMTARAVLDKVIKPDGSKAKEFVKDGIVFAAGTVAVATAKDKTVKSLGLGFASSGVVKATERATGMNVLKGIDLEGIMQGASSILGLGEAEPLPSDNSYIPIQGTSVDEEEEEYRVPSKTEPVAGSPKPSDDEEEECNAPAVSGTDNEYIDFTEVA